MKNHKWTGLGLAVAGLLAWSPLAMATDYSLLSSLATVDNTTSNSSSVAVGGFYLTGNFTFQNAGLTATNAERINIQLSMDNTNFITVCTYQPTHTNATNEAYSPLRSALPVYMRAQVVTTESVQVGGIYAP